MTSAAAPWVGRFQAMACPCEVLLDTEDSALANDLLAVARTEAQRVEAQFSRYLPNNLLHQINSSQGQPIEVDPETAQLLDFAQTCYQLSEGIFDITTGVLRRAWSFGPKAQFPEQEKVKTTLAFVGWDKVRWEKPRLTLQPGMEIDLGGIAKEYAVDRALALIRQRSSLAALVNFGGDIAAYGPRRNGEAWSVGIESVDQEGVSTKIIYLVQGGLTTSGDSKRFILHEGRRYSHILNPKTGYPVEDAPRSITVAAESCTQAGFLSTLGMLKGPGAESFLEQSGVRFWCSRSPTA